MPPKNDEDCIVCSFFCINPKNELTITVWIGPRQLKHLFVQFTMYPSLNQTDGLHTHTDHPLILVKPMCTVWQLEVNTVCVTVVSPVLVQYVATHSKKFRYGNSFYKAKLWTYFCWISLARSSDIRSRNEVFEEDPVWGRFGEAAPQGLETVPAAPHAGLGAPVNSCGELLPMGWWSLTGCSNSAEEAICAWLSFCYLLLSNRLCY